MLDVGLSGEYKETKQYALLMDGAMKEVVRLLKSDTMSRFYRTDDYVALTQQRKLSGIKTNKLQPYSSNSSHAGNATTSAACQMEVIME